MQPRPPSGKRVLVIEDNDDVRETLTALLHAWGYAVEAAVDGLDGVARLLAARPYCALVDLGLPGLDGCEIARRVRAAPGGRRVLLIALSGYGRSRDRRAALDAGFDEHLVKPVEPDELMQRLLEAPGDALARRG